MALIRQTSPHTRGAETTSRVMQLVMLAALPGLLVTTAMFGWGTFINLIWISLIAVGSEALVARLRKRPVAFYLRDYSALVTAVLLALALPPLAPWWLTLIGTAFAIIVAKHLYGGLGQNPFNPAMVGYVLLLISFPADMVNWLPAAGTPGYETLSFGQSLQAIFPFLGGNLDYDAITMATALDVVRENSSLTWSELQATNAALGGTFAGKGWEWVNIAYLAGGLFLLYRKVFTWHAPVGMLGALIVMSLVFKNGSGSDTHGTVLFHLLSGATMLGAFFIVTDPVSGATSNRGRLIFGAGVGILVYVIRAWGGYPDAVAFAVLLMNMAAPTIDYYTQPRTYGHKKPRKGLAKPEDR
ncbi:electron transport complex subunit RsxD [Spongorhabdus nitratireducens]